MLNTIANQVTDVSSKSISGRLGGVNASISVNCWNGKIEATLWIYTHFLDTDVVELYVGEQCQTVSEAFNWLLYHITTGGVQAHGQIVNFTV
jgi:hypothetical protein